MTSELVKQAWSVATKAQQAARGATTLTLRATLFASGIVAGASVARLGTDQARLGATGFLLGTLLVPTLVGAYRWYKSRDPLLGLLRATSRAQPELAEKIGRAHDLALRSEADLDLSEVATSAQRATAELAALHLQRKLSSIDFGALAAGAQRLAMRVSVVSLLLAAAVVVAVAVEPTRTLEGMSVWASRKGIGAFSLLYADEVELTVDTPRHTSLGRLVLTSTSDVELPRGSVITMRARPLLPGRNLVLTDGVSSERFVPDGKGAVVARWTVKNSADLRIAATFGSVRVEQHDVLALESVADEAPQVTLAGAPQKVKLVDRKSLALSWQATDDYGLAEIALVLRAGDAEERRSLSKPHTQTKAEQGAFELSTQEAFFKRSHIPVEVTIQARDNDSVIGSKWGSSQAFIVIPPIVGEPEAKRHLALSQARDGLVDLLATRVSAAPLADVDAFVRADEKAEKAAIGIVESALSESYGGLRVVGSTRRVFAGQLRRLETAGKAFRAAPNSKALEALTTVTEEVVLAVDSSVRGSANSEAGVIAKKLALVAEDAQKAANAAQTEVEAERGRERLGAALLVLLPAAHELSKLGDLGADLGDLTRSGTEKIQRAVDSDQLFQAELAAQHLAERLRQPTFSIGGGGRPGVESGGSDGSGVADGEASEAHDLAESAGKSLEDLIAEHQAELDNVDRALEEATTKEERDALKKLAQEQAEALRNAVKNLPNSGAPGSASEQAAKAKQRIQSMATKLERGKLKDAIAEGKEGLAQLREAKKRAALEEFVDDEVVGAESTRAGNRVEEAITELERLQKAVDDQAKERAKDALSKAGKNEGKLAEKADDLRQKGEQGDAAMPQNQLDRLRQAAEAMRAAKEALEKGDVEQGAEKQRDAQRVLEMSRDVPDDAREPMSDAPNSAPTASGEGKPSQDGEVPSADQHKNPEEWRKRVMDGLSKPHDKRQRDALRRYTEGLLR